MPTVTCLSLLQGSIVQPITRAALRRLATAAGMLDALTLTLTLHLRLTLTLPLRLTLPLPLTLTLTLSLASISL